MFARNPKGETLGESKLQGHSLDFRGKVWGTQPSTLALGSHQFRDQGMLSLLNDPPHGVHSLHWEPQAKGETWIKGNEESGHAFNLR